MNYLAHAYLSFEKKELLVGNMMGDFIKGKMIDHLPKPLQAGVLLHRYIDTSTDNHPLFIEATKILKPHFKLSAAIFTDIFFDHFLAKNKHYFNEESLKFFTTKVYQELFQYQIFFNEKMNSFFNYMKEYDWLFHYHTVKGIERSVNGLCKRYPRLGNSQMVMEQFENHYQEFEHIFQAFFPQLEKSVQRYIHENIQ